MNRKKYYALLFFSSLCMLFLSCEKTDDEIKNREIEFKVSVFYSIDEEEKIDVGSQVFVYYNKNKPDLFDFEYLGNGVFSNDSTKIMPDLKLFVKENGFVMINTEYIKSHDFLIMAESNYFKGRLIDTYLNKFKQGMSLVFIFK